jgi:NADH:ubiquinone reductase (non-electrogenic)
MTTLWYGKDAHKWCVLHKHYMAKWCLSLLAAVSRADRQRLLHVVIVGGGPTGVEFAGELSNFIRSVSLLALAPL